MRDKDPYGYEPDLEFNITPSSKGLMRFRKKRKGKSVRKTPRDLDERYDIREKDEHFTQPVSRVLRYDDGQDVVQENDISIVAPPARYGIKCADTLATGRSVALSNISVDFANDDTAGDNSDGFLPTAANGGGCINQILRGPGSFNRIGKRIKLHAVHVRGTIKGSDVTASVATVVIFLVYQKNVPLRSSECPALRNEILTDLSLGPNAFTNLDTTNQFQILRRWSFNVIGNTELEVTSKSAHYLDEFVLLGGRLTEWEDQDLGSYFYITQGALLLYATSDATNFALVQVPNVLLSTRLYWYDD